MASPILITLKATPELTPTEIAECYALAARTGLLFQPGMLESTHLAHQPMIVLAHQDGRLVGMQAHSFYRVHTPFRRRKMALIYGGLAFQDAQAAGRGIAHRMVAHYMRQVLGPFWAWRDYSFLIGTVNPRLIQLMGIQHRLYLSTDNTLTPSLIQFVQEFARRKRSDPHPTSDQLIASPSGTLLSKNDVTDQWPLLYRASQERYNQLAYHLKLIELRAGRQYLSGNFLLVLGRSSRSRLLKASWTYGRKWFENRLQLSINKS